MNGRWKEGGLMIVLEDVVATQTNKRMDGRVRWDYVHICSKDARSG